MWEVWEETTFKVNLPSLPCLPSLCLNRQPLNRTVLVGALPIKPLQLLKMMTLNYFESSKSINHYLPEKHQPHSVLSHSVL